MSDNIPIKLLKRVTSECRYCGGRMFPSFDGNIGEFYFRCQRCKSQSAACRFDPFLINSEGLKDCINNALVGLDIDFDFEDDEEEDIHTVEEKKIDGLDAMRSSILNSYNVFKQKVMNELDNAVMHNVNNKDQ